ncbi:MAG: HAMP domain-containing histidine kinase [Phycisphaeraceae bacterium]|nr:MAG: HAMP domain-containing histidine kinase [Phycisphaeraceae bacterium]
MPDEDRPNRGTARQPKGLLASMRIRKKLIFLHSVFSVLLTLVLLVAVRPAVQQVVSEAEGAFAERTARAVLSGAPPPEAYNDLLIVRRGDPASLGLTPADAARLRGADGPIGLDVEPGLTWRAGGSGDSCVLVGARLASARRAAWGVYGLLIAALVAVYALIAAALEIFVLPRNVYGPIRVLLEADRAVERGDGGRELVDDSAIPADEMGEIMRSRNNAIQSIRRHETALAKALDELELVAADLKRKNHLLENAKRNLEGADRLMSLGMMSAGIAHELNTPLAVAKGLVERLLADPSRPLEPSQAELLGRVIGRLERLSDGLLDFARAREPEYAEAELAAILDEAITLVRLDRVTTGLTIRHTVGDGVRLECDADRMVQVFVNLVRNAVDAFRSNGQAKDGTVEVSAEAETRDGVGWITVRVVDNGPGIDPDVLPTLFDPFVSTRLDSKGTGLGLAVAEGIVREHAGTIIASNRRDGPGAVFEIVMPRRPLGPPASAADREEQP